jgi:anti-sigma regulatory factor (Ser/Thr protein kinase)
MPFTTVRTVRQYHMVLPGVRPDAMEPVREIMRAHLRLWSKSELSDAAELGVTELLTNVWKHTRGDCELLVRETQGGILVGVTDFDGTLPSVKEPTEDQEGGRGLFLLSVIADELAAEPLSHGKHVWFRLDRASSDRGEGKPSC